MTGALDWDAARELAARAGAPLAPVPLPLRTARDAVPSDDVRAPGPVPHYDSSAMDGWVVRGAPPWRLLPAGSALGAGEGAVVVTGGLVPPEAGGVVPVERGVVQDGLLRADPPRPDAHVRRAGEEAAEGAVLVPAGTRLTPAHLAMLAVAGLDGVLARPAPRIAAVLTGDEVVLEGLPAPGRVRDAFDPLIPAAIAGLGARAVAPARCGDDPLVIAAAIGGAEADAVVTVRGTGRSGADRLREALARLGAEPGFAGVAMRPGHPAMLARLADGRPLIALPGNPLAAVVALLSFLPPLLAGLAGAAVPPLAVEAVGEAFAGWAGGTSVVPARRASAGLEPVPAARPNMLRGLASADALAVVPPDGVRANAAVRVLPLPW
ncbi:MAG: molybdopterin molybdotransferase MoeA [Amnibacterium sp.]